MWQYKRKLFLLSLYVSLLLLFKYVLQGNPRFVSLYDTCLYYPFQSLRGALFKYIPFSIGDILYVLGGVWLLMTIIKWVRYLVKFSMYKEQLVWSVITAANTVLFCYLLFLISWGVNYYKPPLRELWGLKKDTTARSVRVAILIAFDKFLVDKVNYYAPLYKDISFDNTNQLSQQYYKNYTDSKVSNLGIYVKPSLFGYYLERMDVVGYYDPFTGEAQVNDDIPHFVMPFNVCHEMAHQAGIAAEGDANLLAYGVCTMSQDPSFRYSAYFILWLYTNERMYYIDSAMANSFTESLNSLTRRHIDTLEQIMKKYHDGITKMSSSVYDNYLKMQDQHEGIRSYGSVSANAWKLELQRSVTKDSILHVP